MPRTRALTLVDPGGLRRTELRRRLGATLLGLATVAAAAVPFALTLRH